jgi:ceramide glucosyltransferase
VSHVSLAEVPPLSLAVAVGTAVYLLLSALRVALAIACLRRPGPMVAPAGVAAEPITVLQAVRSGDPLLASQLRENLVNHPGARFLWLVDADDPEGRQVTAELSAAGAGAAVMLMPPLPAGANPKVFKLARALSSCGELVAVLDDDTVLPPGALERARRELSRGDLVTGIPVYRPGRGLYGKLLSALVNGSALVTYLPLLWFMSPVTINGMFYLTRRSVLESLGGFAAIQDRLCDDYELAKLYRGAGRRIVQSTIMHPLSTTVPDLTTYLRLMRRWMIFADQLLREELPVAGVGLVVLPGLLPLALVLAAALCGQPPLLAAVLLSLLAKATAMAVLRRRAAATDEGPQTVLLEVLADLLLPLHAATALVRPGVVQWRDRVIQVHGGVVNGPRKEAGGL